MKFHKVPLINRISREEMKIRLLQEQEPRTTISFYRYYPIEDPHAFRDDLFLRLSGIRTFGRIYVAKEGINGQISVPATHVDEFRNILYSYDFLNGIRLNIAVDDDGKSFFLLKIKVRDKIVADGIDDPTFNSSDMGIHLKAEAFNAITDDPDTILVDMRNHYESEVGHFENAITPDVVTFRESLPIIADMLKDKKDRNIVMYCTGGIRCEKASAYMKHSGFKNVFQLEGGIIEYARRAKALGIPNKFKGTNFVFDERLGERISGEIISKCHQCGKPCDHHVNCANEHCHLLFIQCDECAAKFHHCCSQTCTDFKHLPQEEQDLKYKTMVFNGSKFGKGRYRAHHPEEQLS